LFAGTGPIEIFIIFDLLRYKPFYPPGRVNASVKTKDPANNNAGPKILFAIQ